MSTTQFPISNNSIIQQQTNNEYTNPTFQASSHDLTFPDRSRQQQNIWSTSQSYLPSESQYNIKNTNLKGKNLDKPHRNHKQPNKFTSKKKTNKRCILIAAIIIAISIAVCTAIALSLTYYYYWKPQSEKLATCSEECTDNKYCLSSQIKGQNSTCSCKPGYQLSLLTNRCEQITCSTSYYPYTYLNDVSPQTPAPFDTQYTRPYCCPNPNYLTNACCGMSTSEPMQVSKRIIGGQKLQDGVFPWVVFVTQVYRSGPGQSIRMIKNCSGTLLNERYVLTAAHCLDVDRGLFNSEFSNAASMTRVYFGFVNKAEIFRDGMEKQHERRVQRVRYNLLNKLN